ncbi:MAG: cell wall hydrolase [Halanaerobiales bacterium]|nr:cell wall hydrolase [Halanaerobiales bacterium]
MKTRVIRITSIILIIILIVMINSVLFSNPVLSPTAQAREIETRDIVTGLAAAFILYLLFESVDNDYSDEIKIDQTELNNQEKIEIRVDSINIDLLARAIYAEARGESLQGQIAVGAVIVNRMKSNNFPNTIKEVLYQYNQFKCIDNGQINNMPNQTAYRAAQRAVDGEDPSQGALFFFNPDKSQDPDAFNKYEVTVIIGNHVFAK